MVPSPPIKGTRETPLTLSGHVGKHKPFGIPPQRWQPVGMKRRRNQKRKGELWADPGLRGFAKRRSMAEHVASWMVMVEGDYKQRAFKLFTCITLFIYIYNSFGVLILFHLKEFIDLLFVLLRFLNNNYRTPYIWAREKEHFAGTKKAHKERTVSKQKVIRTFAPQNHGKMKILGPNIIWVITNPTKKWRNRRFNPVVSDMGFCVWKKILQFTLQSAPPGYDMKKTSKTPSSP